MGYSGGVISEPDVVLGGRYVLIRQIAVGGMGEVWEATDTLLDRPVAVKILKDEFRSASTFLARFRAEARHAGQLSHTGIATVYDYGETPDVAFLVMELVRGQPLSDLMVEQTDLSTMTKLSILRQAADALHAAHEAGVVHRDVKPSNLMVRDDGTVKVTDFGIARALSSAPLTDHGQMIGTPAYVSPEQAVGDQVTGSSDIYSLAVVAYELFAGRPPFERDTPLGLALAHVNDPLPPLPDSVPRRIGQLIESALAKDPSQRPPSAAHFADQLRQEMAAMQASATRVLPAREEQGPALTVVMPSTSAPVVGRASILEPVAARRGAQRRSSVLVAALAGLLVLLGATALAATRPAGDDDARSDLSAASTISEPSAVSPETSASTVPASTVPDSIVLDSTVPDSTVPASTVPATTLPPLTLPPSTSPPLTLPPPAEATPVAVTADSARIAEGEAVAFVLDYYERVGAGDYATTWESLTPEFRDARNLTFDRYVSYWENTTIDLRDLRFQDGPGVDEGRVVFEARYDTGSRVVNETDEITLARHPDGQLVITAQRTV